MHPRSPGPPARCPALCPAREVIDPAAAEAAYPHVAPRLAAIPPARVIFVPGDLQVAAEVALAAARFANEPGARERFARLATIGEIDADCACDLAWVALAAWYVFHRWSLNAAALGLPSLPVSTEDGGPAWAAMVPRAWTLLLATYADVRRAGRFLFAGAADERRFPCLLAVSYAGAPGHCR
jgi:hypothetical protein